MQAELKRLTNPTAAACPPQGRGGFPLAKVKKAASNLSKTFHSKVFTLFASTISDIYSFSRRLTPHFTYGFAFLKDEQGLWYFDTDDVLKVRQWVLKCVRNNPKIIWQVYKAWQSDWKNFTRLSTKLLSVDLRRLDNAQLYRLFEEYHKKYVLAGSIAYMTDCFMSVGREDWLEELLMRELGRGKRDENLRMDIKKLLTPPTPSYSSEAEKLLLQFLACSPRQTRKRKSLLSEYRSKYYWIENNYHHVRFVDEKLAQQKASHLEKELRKQSTTGRQRLRELETERKQQRREQLQIFRRLQPSPFAQNLIRTAWLFATWKDMRKSGVCIGMEQFDRFLTEVARRTQYNKHELIFAIMPEMKTILLDGKDMAGTFKARENQVFFAVTGTEYFILSGKEANDYYKYFSKVTRAQHQDLQGMPASPGIVTGIVRVIRKTSEMAGFQRGEILITNQTTPEFVPVMKKAAAIVTEQGGITSHAAIISRELKKPCVIGTKIATQVLSTGDRVRVDAHRGIVEKLP